MKIDWVEVMTKLGIQFYSCRKLFEENYINALEEISKLGFQGIEFPGGTMEKVSAEKLKETLETFGLEVAGITFELDDFENRLKELICYCKCCNCKTVIFPSFTEEFCKDEDGFRQIAEKMMGWAKQLKEQGIQLLYHIHGVEFQEFNGSTGFKIWFSNIDTEFIKLEPDVYWIEKCKIDSVEFLKEYAAISPSIHFKDCVDRTSMKDTEVGNGCLNLDEIAEIGLKNKAQWFISEQEHSEMSEIESATTCLDNLKLIYQNAMKKIVK